jgi:prevent-host-death family protein
MEELVVTTTDLARRTRELLDRVRKHNVQVLVTRHGQPEAAILDIDEFRALVADRERLHQLEQDESQRPGKTCTHWLDRPTSATPTYPLM